jgi:hypothetical protein
VTFMFYYRGTYLSRAFIFVSPLLTALLYSRSATLSSYAGDTALPGGRWDKMDASIEDTAVSIAQHDTHGWALLTRTLQRREAFEEVSYYSCFTGYH